jgi:hypothetical protein
VLLIGFDFLENTIVTAIWPHAHADDSPELTSLRTSVSFALMIFVALLPFFGIRELSRVMGEAQVRQLFFRNRSAFKLVPKA